MDRGTGTRTREKMKMDFYNSRINALVSLEASLKKLYDESTDNDEKQRLRHRIFNIKSNIEELKMESKEFVLS